MRTSSPSCLPQSSGTLLPIYSRTALTALAPFPAATRPVITQTPLRDDPSSIPLLTPCCRRGIISTPRVVFRRTGGRDAATMSLRRVRRQLLQSDWSAAVHRLVCHSSPDRHPMGVCAAMRSAPTPTLAVVLFMSGAQHGADVLHSQIWRYHGSMEKWPPAIRNGVMMV